LACQNTIKAYLYQLTTEWQTDKLTTITLSCMHAEG